MTDQSEVTIYIPGAFRELLERRKWRYQIYYGGRGGAKSHTIARAVLLHCMQERTRVVCLRETMESLEDSVYKLLCDLIDEFNLHGEFRILEGKIRHRTNKSEIKFKGLSGKNANIKSLEGADIAWVEEAEGVSDDSWEKLIPTIRKAGSEIWVSFNTRFVTDPTYRRFIATSRPDAYVRKVSFRDNRFFSAELEAERVALMVSDMEAYMHVWEGEPDARREGYIYPKQLAKMHEQKRVGRYPYDPSSPVYVAWDIGWGDAMAIWFFQIIGREPRFIKYYEQVNAEIKDFLKYINEQPYTYARIPLFFPHDGAHGNARGKSPRRQALQFGFKNVVFKKTESVTADIDGVRELLGYCVIDEIGCAEGLEKLASYQYKFNEQTKTFSKTPLHNPASNGADAFRTASYAVDFLKGKPIETVNDAGEIEEKDRKNDISIYKRAPHETAVLDGTWMGA